MYHYVRPDNKDYPYLKSLNLEIFKRQLDYFEKMFGFLTKDEYMSLYLAESKGINISDITPPPL